MADNIGSMNVSSLVTFGGDYLEHHGIKGQKWGVRRFQNEDGSYTKLGRTRYGRGKALSKEEHRIQQEEYKRLKNSSATYKKLWDEADRLQKKYELDGDDGGGGNTEKYSRAQLDAAGRRYWDKQVELSDLDDKFYDKAYKIASKKIVDKYGDVALKDIEHYDRVNTGLFLGSVGTLIVGSLITALRK